MVLDGGPEGVLEQLKEDVIHVGRDVDTLNLVIDTVIGLGQEMRERKLALFFLLL